MLYSNIGQKCTQFRFRMRRLVASAHQLQYPETDVTETSQAAADMIGNDDGELISSG